MFKKTKMALMSLLCVGCCVAAGAGAVSYSVQASAETPAFQVDAGAAVRLKAEDADFGIRFSATVGEVVEGAKYNMLILPVELVDYYNADSSEGKADIVTYMKALASANGGTLSIIEDCAVRTDGKIYGSIVNVLWNNINRDFVAVAYYEKDGAVTVAEMANTNAERSIGSICEEALKSGDFDTAGQESNKNILVKKLALAEKQKDGIAQTAVYYNETFDYAAVSATESYKVTYTDMTHIADFQQNGEVSVVEENGNKALKYTKKVAAWNLVELLFSDAKIPAGSYKLTFDLKELDDTYHKWILCGWDGDSYDAWYKTIQSDNAIFRNGNTYTYYFTYGEEGYARFGLCGQGTSSGWGSVGEIIMDNVSLTEVDAIPTKAPVVFESADFENKNPLTPLKDYGIYLRDSMSVSAMNYGENDSMTLTSSAYGAIYFYMGNVTKGSYILKIDAEFSDGHPSVMVAASGMTFNADTTVASYGTDIYFNYTADVAPTKTTSFASIASNNNGSRELLITISQDYTNFAIGIANNLSDKAYTMTIDNISMEKVDYTKGYTVDFENGFNTVATKVYKGSSEVNAGTSRVNAGNYIYANFAPTVVDASIAGGETSKALQTTCNGWGGNFGVNLGYCEAGTYTITVDIAGSAATRGSFRIWSTLAGTYQTVAYSADGKHTFTFTLEAGDQIVFAYKDAANNQSKFTLQMDNLTITKTA